MRGIKGLAFISLMILAVSGGSLSYAQTNTFPSDGSVGVGTTTPGNNIGGGGSNLGGTLLQFNSNTTTAYQIIDAKDEADLVLARKDGTVNTRIVMWRLDADYTKFISMNDNLGVRKDNILVMELATGNVGIGTKSPTSKLHVAGDATIDGNIAAKYQDVAEWVRTPVPLKPGTVVVIDPLESNRVLPASQPYDTRIAGVVSPQPGILLGEAGEDKAKVAHSGRVKVKVDAQFGPISVGDLLVSSATTGYAMRSTPIEMNGISIHRPGTIVGKALEPLKEGEGEILVLLTLQ